MKFGYRSELIYLRGFVIRSHFVHTDDPCYDEVVTFLNNSDRTLREEDMEPCVPTRRYDYFTGSKISFAVSHAVIFLFVIGYDLAAVAYARLFSKGLF